MESIKTDDMYMCDNCTGTTKDVYGMDVPKCGKSDLSCEMVMQYCPGDCDLLQQGGKK